MRGFTVEMSLIAPLILFLLMSSIFGVFYFHDKNIIAGAVYETVVVGGTKAREKEGADAGELEQLFQERIKGKCILFDEASVSVDVRDDEIEVTASGFGRGMKVSVSRRIYVTGPEKKIRDIRRTKGLGNGAKSNN